MTYQRSEQGRCWVAYFLERVPAEGDGSNNNPTNTGDRDREALKSGYRVGVQHFPVIDQGFEAARQRAVALARAHPLPEALFQVYDKETAERIAAADASGGRSVAAALSDAAAGGTPRLLNTFASMPPSTSQYVQFAIMERRLQLLLSGVNPAVAWAVAAEELGRQQGRGGGAAKETGGAAERALGLAALRDESGSG